MLARDSDFIYILPEQLVDLRVEESEVRFLDKCNFKVRLSNPLIN